jgi:hypothetical protein
MHAQSKKFGCLKFLSVKHNWKFKNDILGTGPDTENTDHGPDIAFYGPLVNQSE